MGPRTVTVYRTSRNVRYALIGLATAVVALIIAVAVVTGWVLTLRDARIHQQAAQQRQIEVTFCQVLAQLPANSPELDQIRHQLHCTSPGLSPEQMRQLATTGGTP